MQTASKIEIDNWSDINNVNGVMNIRPVGTYTKPNHDLIPSLDEHSHPMPHVPHHDHCHPKSGSHVHHDIHHHCPIDEQPIPPHFHPIDVDNDGFVENDVIVKPMPHIHDHHVHHLPMFPEHVHEHHDVPSVIEEFETTEDFSEEPIDTVTEEDTVETTALYGSAIETVANVGPVESLSEIDDVLTDVWATSKVINTETDEIVAEEPEAEVEVAEVEEPVKPVRTRRVNRGGRRRKED